MVALTGVTVGSDLSMVSPNMKRQGTNGSVPYRIIILTASSLIIVGTVFAILAVNNIQHSVSPISAMDSELYHGMPDPVQAVQEADYTVQSVLPFHQLEEQAGSRFGATQTEPRRLTRPKFATLLGQEAALHASSQPFLVPLVRNGRRIPGAIAPDGEYAPVTPAYSNPLARFIPNVTYYPVGNTAPSTDGVQKPKIYNPFDADNTTIGFAPPAANAHPALAEDKGSRYGNLAKLYSALAEQQEVLKRDSLEETKIQQAIRRLSARSSKPIHNAPGTDMAADSYASRPVSYQTEMPDFSSEASAPDRWSGYRSGYRDSVGESELRYPGMVGAERVVAPIVTISPRGPGDIADDDMPQYA